MLKEGDFVWTTEDWIKSNQHHTEKWAKAWSGAVGRLIDIGPGPVSLLYTVEFKPYDNRYYFNSYDLCLASGLDMIIYEASFWRTL